MKDNKTSEMKVQKQLQFQILQQHLQEISQQLELLQQQQAELEVSIEALKELEESKKQTEFLAPLANGIFAQGQLSNTEIVVVNVGSNVTVEMSIPQVVELLQQQQKEVLEKVMEADALLQGLGAEAIKVYKGLEKE